MLHSLRFRLLALFLTCIAILTLINILVGSWGLVRVRDRTTSDSASALEQQAAGYLQNLAQERADATVEILRTGQQVAAATRDYLSKTTTPGQDAKPLTFQTTATGRRYHHGVTTVLLPAEGDTQALAGKLAESQGLDILLPGLARNLAGVARVSYLTSYGAIRTYPALNPYDLPANWTVEHDPAYKIGLADAQGTIVWSEIHPALNKGGQVVSAVAPITQHGQVVGSVVVDIGLPYLTGYLKRIKIEKSGFAFLIDNKGHLITAPEEGQDQLLGRTISVTELGAIDLEKALPSFGGLLADMRAGRGNVAMVEARGRIYMVAYAPVTPLGWSLGLAAPLDEITTSTRATSAQIAGMAAETRLLSLLASLGAVVVLGLVISLALRRRIIQPLGTLVAATQAIAAGDLRRITIGDDGEIGQLAASFNSMTTALEESHAAIVAANQQLERKVQERTADLDRTVAQLEVSTARQRELLRSLREVSTPVVPVVEGVLAMPLIGQIDDERAQNMTSALLARIERERARTVLLDITGVPVIDTHVAQALLRVVAASRLLGADVVLVGVSPEVAQTIVSLGIELNGLRTAADLRSAVEQLLAQRRNGIKSAVRV